LASNRSAFPPSVSEAIRLAWRKRREMFESYVDPRNVIEHIPDEVGDKERWILMNLHGDVLVADEKSSAEVSRANLDRAVAARTEIVDALQANKGRGT